MSAEDDLWLRRQAEAAQRPSSPSHTQYVAFTVLASSAPWRVLAVSRWMDSSTEGLNHCSPCCEQCVRMQDQRSKGHDGEVLGREARLQPCEAPSTFTGPQTTYSSPGPALYRPLAHFSLTNNPPHFSQLSIALWSSRPVTEYFLHKHVLQGGTDRQMVSWAAAGTSQGRLAAALCPSASVPVLTGPSKGVGLVSAQVPRRGATQLPPPAQMGPQDPAWDGSKPRRARGQKMEGHGQEAAERSRGSSQVSSRPCARNTCLWGQGPTSTPTGSRRASLRSCPGHHGSQLSLRS